jgi:hypothetical protein
MIFSNNLSLTSPIIFKILAAPCPHCQKSGFLRAHGFLKGHLEGTTNKQVVRARRFYCTKRYKKIGCGKTFSIYLSQFLPNRFVSACSIKAFFQNLLSKKSISKANPFKNSSKKLPYRLLQKVISSQSAIRNNLCQIRPPPDDFSGASPVIQTIAHLLITFPQDPVESYHFKFQTPLF